MQSTIITQIADLIWVLVQKIDQRKRKLKRKEKREPKGTNKIELKTTPGTLFMNRGIQPEQKLE